MVPKKKPTPKNVVEEKLALWEIPNEATEEPPRQLKRNSRV